MASGNISENVSSTVDALKHTHNIFCFSIFKLDLTLATLLHNCVVRMFFWPVDFP